MTSRRNYPSDHMYGGRSGRTTETRDGVPMSRLSLVNRRQSSYGADDNNNKTGRGKTIADEDSRVVSRAELRVSSFLGASGKSRASIEHNDQRALVNNSYAAISDRRGAFRDDGMLKIVRRDDAPLRGESSSRFRDGGSGRGERSLRSAPSYEDEPKWFRNGNYESGSYDGGVGSMRDTDYLSAKPTSSISTALPGFILECSKRTILNFSTQKGTFLLPVDDRRLAEQVAPGTKIFLMDANVRELHGVFQADSYAIVDIHEGSGMQVRVRIAKGCIPLTERQFKHIIHEDYYSNSKFTDALSKDQVMKLLGTFRPLDARRQVQLPLPSTRRTIESGLSPSNPEFQSLPDEVVYRKDERWRREFAESRSLGSHSYGQGVGRLLTKLPAQTHLKGLDDYEVYAEDELEEGIPLSSSRVVASANLYSNSRSRQQALRSLPGSRTGGTHSLGNAGYSELKSADADWTDEMDLEVPVYRKRRPVSSGSLDDSKRGDRSASPAWKDVVSRADEVVSEIYDRSGKSAYKEDLSYLSTRRHRHSEIDLNIPLDSGRGETENVHSMELKGPRRRMWGNDDEKSYSVTPPKGRSVIPRNSALRLSDRLLPSNLADDYEDPRLDTRHMVSVPRKNFPLMRSEEKGRSVSNNYTNGKFGKLPQRTVPLKTTTKEKPLLSSASRKRPASLRDSYGQDSSGLRTSKLPFVKFKANVPQGKGQPTRVVTLVSSSQPRPDGVMVRNDLRAWKSANADEYGIVRESFQGRKKKASVWSRISLPGKSLLPNPAGVSQGRGRVFSRLGPSITREGTQAHQRKKLRMDPKADSEILISPEGSPDALEGEDYLYDDPEEVDGDKETEMAAEDLQGWTRKKILVVADSLREEPTVPDRGDYTNAKGARRKLVRPSTEDNDGWKHLGSSSIGASGDLMDMEMTNVEIVEVVSPLASRLDLNSAKKDVRPNLEEDNLLSL